LVLQNGRRGVTVVVPPSFIFGSPKWKEGGNGGDLGPPQFFIWLYMAPLITTPKYSGKHILLSIVFAVLFIMFFFESTELIALGATFGIQVINSLYLFNDMYYANISGDRIGAVLIITSVIIFLLASTLLITGLIRLNIEYSAELQPLIINTVMRTSLTLFEIAFIVNYFLLVIVSIIYFLSYPFRIPSENTGGLSFYEGVAMFIKFVFSIASIGVGIYMIYMANIFTAFVNVPTIEMPITTKNLSTRTPIYHPTQPIRRRR
jgi:hypothetical protein